MSRSVRKLDLDSAAELIRPRDAVFSGLATGQPIGLLEALGRRRDLADIVLYCGLLVRPYALLQNPAVRVVSGFFGPIDRAARAGGARIEYLAADFHGFERLALRLKPRVVIALTSPPDAEGWLSFGLHAGASYSSFLEAARDPERLAIAEVNPRMPRVAGIPELGANRVHVSEIDAWAESDADIVTLAGEVPSPADLAIARHVSERIEDGSILQFGIGAIPDEIGHLLATGQLGNFGIHTEMISDAVMRLHQAGKVTNRKALYDGVTVATFALGSQALYEWLDENPAVRIAPVSAINDSTVLHRLRRLVSINAALAIDLGGQVAADHVGGRQYSGVGGHESFVMGASEAPEGKSFICLKSTAMVGGQRISTIVPRLPEDAMVTTPRHHVQHVVTEYGAVDLSALTDVERPRSLTDIAHPDFRDALRAAQR